MQLSLWCLRRVLLAGDDGCMLRAMHSQLRAIGARPACAPRPIAAESLFRVLHEGRFSCVIVPDLLHLGTGDEQLAALDTLLGESREAGVPLVMLLARHTPHQAAGIAALFSHAQGWAHGAFGDPVSVQCIRYSGTNRNSVCCQALRLGARFLAGEQDSTGVYTITEEADADTV